MEVGKRFNPYNLFHGCYVPEWLARRREISQGAKLLYGRLIRFAGKNGKCNPRSDILSNELGVSRRQIVEYLKELKEHELIEAERKGRGRSNDYFFLFHLWIVDSNDVKNTSHQNDYNVKNTSQPDEKISSHPEVKNTSHPLYIRESIEESQGNSARERIKKILEGITPPPALKELLEVDGLRAAYLDYRCYLKEKYNFWPQPTEVVQDYKKLFELMQAGDPPVKVIEQTIQAKNKSFYELRNFQKNGDAAEQVTGKKYQEL